MLIAIAIFHQISNGDLAREAAAEVHGARSRTTGLQPEHDGRRELVVGRTAGRLLLDFNDVDRVPAALDLLGVAVPCLLYQYHA